MIPHILPRQFAGPCRSLIYSRGIVKYVLVLQLVYSVIISFSPMVFSYGRVVLTVPFQATDLWARVR